MDGSAVDTDKAFPEGRLYKANCDTLTGSEHSSILLPAVRSCAVLRAERRMHVYASADLEYCMNTRFLESDVATA